MVIGSLVTNIVADLSKWGPNLNKGRSQLASFVKGVNVFKAVIAGVVAGELTSWFVSSVKQAGALKDLAARLNTTVEGIQRLDFAATQLGSDAGSLNKGIGFFNKVLGQAEMGSSAAAKQFENLKLEAKDISALGSDQGFLRVVEAIRGLPANQQAAAAQGIFGKGAGALLPMIREGSEAIREQMELLSKHEILTGKEADKLDKMADKVERLATAWGTLKMKAAAAVIDVLDIIGKPAEEIAMERIAASGKLLGGGGSSRGGGASRSWPGIPSLGSMQPRTPAMTGPRPGIRPNSPDIIVQQQLRDATKGLTMVMNMLPAKLQIAINKPSLGPTEGLFKGIGGLAAGLGGVVPAMAGGLGRALGGPSGARVGPLEALSANSREGMSKLSENQRARTNDPLTKIEKNTKKDADNGGLIVKGINSLVKAATDAGGIFDF